MLNDKIKKEIKEWVRALAFTLSIGLVMMVFVRPTLVFGESMAPTLEDKQVLITEKVSYILNEPQFGDIVTIKTQEPLFGFTKKHVIKRIIGLPGDQVDVTESGVYLNGQFLEEDYLKDDFVLPIGTFSGQVPPGHVFVLGDNRNHSKDSRSPSYGFIAFKDIQGRAYYSLWPLKIIE